MRLSDLQSKDVVSMNDGKMIGNIIDIIIDSDGKMNGFIVEKHRFLLSLFTSKDEVVVSWKQIEKIGEDVILVRTEIQNN